MSISPFRYSTACPSQSGQGSIASLGGTQIFPVNFSGVPDSSGNPSTFTVGGWFRRQAAETGGTIFTVAGQLLILIDSSGMCSVSLGNAGIYADVPVSDTDWHFVAVTYLPTDDPDYTGVLSLYLDGLLTVSQSVDVNDFGQGFGCYLGLDGAQLEFASWSIWSVALSPDVIAASQWGDPAGGTEVSEGLIAAFDFANGSAQDISGNGYPVEVAAQCQHTPGLEVSPSGYATLETSDPVNPGGGGAFSILGWAWVPSEPVPPDSFLYAYSLLTNNWDTSNPLQLALAVDQAGALSAQALFQDVLPSSPISPGDWDWVHLALTWDGSSTLTLYVNGEQTAQRQSSSDSPIATPNVVIGSCDEDAGTWYMQGLSVWNTCLGQDDINNYMGGADPTEVPGCVANFALLNDLGDSINQNSLNAVSCQITEMISVFAPQQGVASVLPPAASQLEGPRLLLPHELKAIAKKHGIDVDSPPSVSDVATGEYAEIAQWFDGLTAKLPPQGAARLKNTFLRNVRIGLELRRKGVKAGTFSVSTEGGDTVLYYHTEAGPEEVYRLSGVTLTPMQQWGLTIIADVFSLVFGAFGVVSTGAKITKAVGLLEPEIDSLVNAIQSAYNLTDSALTKARKVAIAILGLIYTFQLTYTVVKQVVVGSWWNLAFTIANTVLMIVAMVVTDGAALVIRIVQMGVQLGQLVYDLTEMPQSETAAA